MAGEPGGSAAAGRAPDAVTRGNDLVINDHNKDNNDNTSSHCSSNNDSNH